MLFHDWHSACGQQVTGQARQIYLKNTFKIEILLNYIPAVMALNQGSSRIKLVINMHNFQWIIYRLIHVLSGGC